MNLDKSCKYVILGIPHNGTSSLEKYLVELDYDVVRDETAFRHKTLEYIEDTYPDRQPIFIISHKTSNEDEDHIHTYWDILDPIIFKLKDLKQDSNFPWENKGNIFKTKPIYKKTKFVETTMENC